MTAPPDFITPRKLFDIAGAAEVWSYPFENQIVEYGFVFQPPAIWRQTQISAAASRSMGGLELQNKRSVSGVRDKGEYKQKLEALKAVK